MLKTLLSQYPAPDTASAPLYHELLTATGEIRPHWAPLIKQLAHTSHNQMRQQLEFLDRRIQENGVTYNVYADPTGSDRPWSLDPLPFILPADEWAKVEQAVAQRAKVINATLADLYGPQKLLSEGLIPPALVYGQHGFLWPCRGITPPGGHFLHIYAADLARSPDGRWWVIADRTQAPSGAGYALENRLAISRLFPELFRDQGVQHVAYFFRAIQESLAAWAPIEGDEQPHIVLLTPGPYNETYFEHAYLSRYLGFPLVEGQDLTVRGDTVYLKTLTGLKRVHVILRRQNDDYCDPLELRGDSALGVPGLVQAIRAKRVLVSNALGSGVMGSGALMGFLPGISQHLLGEDLLMPSVATWWCGEKPALDYALSHVDELVIKGAFPGQGFETVFGCNLDAESRKDIMQRMQARPHAYLAQEMVAPSQAPIWSRGQNNPHDAHRVLARSVGLRVYAVATPNGYLVMPGGLARVAGKSNEAFISMQRGGMSKDTWVLAEGAVDLSTLLKPSLTVKDLVYSGSNLTSRVVESLFWLGRYSERFDNTARFLRICLHRLNGGGNDPATELPLLLTLGDALEVLIPVEKVHEKEKNKEKALAKTSSLHTAPPPVEQRIQNRLLKSLYDPEFSGSLAADIRRAVWSATQVKERLSTDHWHSINSLQRPLQGLQKTGLTTRDAQTFLDQVMAVSSSLNGFTMDNMTRDDGWRFLVVGRRIERLVFLGSVLVHYLTLAAKQGQTSLEWLLELSDSIITYRSRYSRRPELLSTLALLVFDPDNPHSLVFQSQVIQRYLTRLGRVLVDMPTDGLRIAEEKLLTLELARFEARDGKISPKAYDDLAASLAELVQACQTLSNQLAMRYFTHVSDIGRQTLGT
ncbi:MAG: hypothetical protein RIR18_2204 [Pseudomonadota bacterium]|jgi:uncharacterized circularly permuted ATP-grasp superfamily protein/uncharacterized alpha-E superfamily protein